MVLKVLGSSSKGNGYILDSGSEALILECGVSLKEAKKALGFDVRKVAGCCVTHQHNDHAGYLDKYASIFYTLALPEVFQAKAFSGSRAVPVEIGRQYRLGGFLVMPFKAEHDVPCVGWLVNHPSMGLLMFATDTCMLDYTIPGLNHVLIECNYSVEDLRVAIEEHRTDESQVKRLANSHLELSSTKSFLSRNDLSKVAEVVLIHLSGNNANAERFVSEIQALTGKPTYAAYPGLELELIKL